MAYKGLIRVGYVVMFQGFFSMIINSVNMIITIYPEVNRGLDSISSLGEILECPDIELNEGRKKVENIKGHFRFENISFGYDNDNHALVDFSLEVQSGESIAIVGESGSGKSTMVDLIPRFYDVQEGNILIDGIPVRDMKIADLRSLMGNVNQESILFNDSFFNNIAFGVESATLEEVQAAAKIANAHEFIMATEKGYETNIGDRGSKLSGGQRQRISIARAVLKNPPIMILDEATSALDTESEFLVQEALFNLMKNRTSIVIAHRLSTIKHADEICVLHEGEIVERGKHEELLELNGYYKKLYDLQIF